VRELRKFYATLHIVDIVMCGRTQSTIAAIRSSKSDEEYEATEDKRIWGVTFAEWAVGGVKGRAARDRRLVGGSCRWSNRHRARSIFTPNFVGDVCAAPAMPTAMAAIGRDEAMTSNMRRENWSAVVGRRGRHTGFATRSSLCWVHRSVVRPAWQHDGRRSHNRFIRRASTDDLRDPKKRAVAAWTTIPSAVNFCIFSTTLKRLHANVK